MSYAREVACLTYAEGGFGGLHRLWYYGCDTDSRPHSHAAALAAFMLIRALYRYPGDLRP